MTQWSILVLLTDGTVAGGHGLSPLNPAYGGSSPLLQPHNSNSGSDIRLPVGSPTALMFGLSSPLSPPALSASGSHPSLAPAAGSGDVEALGVRPQPPAAAAQDADGPSLATTSASSPFFLHAQLPEALPASCGSVGSNPDTNQLLLHLPGPSSAPVLAAAGTEGSSPRSSSPLPNIPASLPAHLMGALQSNGHLRKVRNVSSWCFYYWDTTAGNAFLGLTASRPCPCLCCISPSGVHSSAGAVAIL